MIAIVGAGPGGLTAACALRHVGLEVQVLERAPTIRPVGAGLTLQPNAMRMLAAIGLGEAVRAAGTRLASARLATADGRCLSEVLQHGDAAFGSAVDRGALSQVLAAQLPEGVVQCGAAVVDAEPDGRVRLQDGTERQFDAVIGADGIHSVVRTSLFGKKPLRYAGYTCWRGIAAAPSGDGLCERWGRGVRFGTVPLPGDRTYWFACANAPAGVPDPSEPLPMLHRRFADFEPVVHQVLDATDQVLHHDLYDLAPLPSWTRDRVTLLGDAAHAMTPNLGQGAGQSIEDAVVLAAAVAEHGVPHGLEHYEQRRKARANRFVRQSWSTGAVAHWQNPVAVGIRTLVMRATPQWAVRRQMTAVYDVAVPTFS